MGKKKGNQKRMPCAGWGVMVRSISAQHRDLGAPGHPWPCLTIRLTPVG